MYVYVLRMKNVLWKKIENELWQRKLLMMVCQGGNFFFAGFARGFYFCGVYGMSGGTNFRAVFLPGFSQAPPLSTTLIFYLSAFVFNTDDLKNINMF